MQGYVFHFLGVTTLRIERKSGRVSLQSGTKSVRFCNRLWSVGANYGVFWVKLGTTITFIINSLQSCFFPLNLCEFVFSQTLKQACKVAIMQMKAIFIFLMVTTSPHQALHFTIYQLRRGFLSNC